jgi:hypothetical protein
MTMPKLSRKASKLKNVPAIKTKSIVAFVCFSSLVSLFYLSTLSLNQEVSPPTASWKESFMQGRPLGTQRKIEITTELCFVTSIYGFSSESSDKPLNVTDLQRTAFPESKFYIFTNMEDLEAPGWNKVIRKFDFKRFITMSRWPKVLFALAIVSLFLHNFLPK